MVPGEGRPSSPPLRLVDTFDVPGADGGLLAIVEAEDTGGSTTEYAMAARVAPDGSRR